MFQQADIQSWHELIRISTANEVVFQNIGWYLWFIHREEGNKKLENALRAERQNRDEEMSGEKRSRRIPSKMVEQNKNIQASGRWVGLP